MNEIDEKLKHCVRSAYLFTEEQIGYALRTQLPDKKTLSEKLHKAIAIARENDNHNPHMNQKNNSAENE